MVAKAFQWLESAGVSPWNQKLFTFVLVLSWVSIAAILRKSVLSEKTSTGSDGARLEKVLSLLILLPFALILLSGSGYAERHSLSFGPGLFILAAYGFHQLHQLNFKLKPLIKGGMLSAAVLLSLGWCHGLLTEPAVWRDTTKKAGEWAVNYNSRKKILRYLIADLKVSPRRYAHKVMWWWMGWAADPLVYQKEIINLGLDPAKLNESDPDPEGYVLTSGAPLFRKKFELEKITTVPETEVDIYKGKPFPDHGWVKPTGNSVNTTKLTELESQLEKLDVQEGMSPIALKAEAMQNYEKASILSLNRGRIKMLILFKTKDVNGKRYFDWKIVSPDLNGYYQEIKTVYKPYFRMEGEKNKKGREELLVDGALGSLLYKTPIEGSIPLEEGDAALKITFGLRGYFDQSNMPEPFRRDAGWNLEEIQ